MENYLMKLDFANWSSLQKWQFSWWITFLQKALTLRKESAYAFSFQKLREFLMPELQNPLIHWPSLRAQWFSSPYETGEVNPNARKAAGKPERPFTLFIRELQPEKEIGYFTWFTNCYVGPAPNSIYQSKLRSDSTFQESGKQENSNYSMMRCQVVELPEWGVWRRDFMSLGLDPISPFQLRHGPYVIPTDTDHYQMSQKLIKKLKVWFVKTLNFLVSLIQLPSPGRAWLKSSMAPPKPTWA